MPSRNVRLPRFNSNHAGRGIEPVIVVASGRSLVALSMACARVAGSDLHDGLVDRRRVALLEQAALLHPLLRPFVHLARVRQEDDSLTGTEAAHVNAVM